jgi:hypothetical protein
LTAINANQSNPSFVGGLAVGGVQSDGSGINIYSNIFSQNSNDGLYFLGAPSFVIYNDFAIRGGVKPSVDIDNVTVSPKFVDVSAGDFHLSSASTLIGFSGGFGYCDQEYDLDGHKRPYYSPCDPGAYAETIFSGGFEKDTSGQ